MDAAAVMPNFKQSMDDYDVLANALGPYYGGPPFALARYADGEAKILKGERHSAKSDGWATSGSNELRERLKASLECTLWGWNVGITAETHHADSHHELLNHVKLEPAFITLAEVFIFCNYVRVQVADLSHCLTIGARAEVDTPRTPDDSRWPKAVDDLVSVMAQSGRTILVSAGPWGKVLIHEYWKRCPNNLKRVCLDMGSALDERRKQRRTRNYQAPFSRKRFWRPTWKIPFKKSSTVPSAEDNGSIS